jgi:hypothetical protein
MKETEKEKIVSNNRRTMTGRLHWSSFFNEIFYFKTKYLTRRHWMRWWRF